MTRETDKPIHRIYKKNFESLGLFFWIEAQKDVLPTITLTQSIDRYYKYINEVYDLNVAIVTVSRMRSEYIGLNYEKCMEKKNTSSTEIPRFKNIDIA